MGNFAKLQSSLGKKSEALQILANAKNIHPEDQSLLGAIRAVETSIDSTAGSDTRHTGTQAAIEEAVKASNWDKVIQLGSEYGELAEGSPWLHFSLGMAMIFKGEVQAGYDLCKRAEITAPNSHLVQGCLGVSARSLKDYAASAAHFEKAYLSLTSNPTNIPSFPSLRFYANVHNMELRLLTALFESGN